MSIFLHSFLSRVLRPHKETAADPYACLALLKLSGISPSKFIGRSLVDRYVLQRLCPGPQGEIMIVKIIEFLHLRIHISLCLVITGRWHTIQPSARIERWFSRERQRHLRVWTDRVSLCQELHKGGYLKNGQRGDKDDNSEDKSRLHGGDVCTGGDSQGRRDC